ncbi:hypothetical protein HN587_01330 [Candidatus Woesearchaeota archaeon]|jgi:hypothetical protein|nr:hypothetical protein [Candidatus Woesearchaeota archaeon]
MIKKGESTNNFLIHIAFIFFLVLGLVFIIGSGGEITGNLVVDVVQAKTKLGGALNSAAFLKDQQDMSFCVGINSENTTPTWLKATTGQYGWNVEETKEYCAGLNSEELVVKFNDYNSFLETMKSFTPSSLLAGRAGEKFFILESKYVKKGGDVVCDQEFKEKYCNSAITVYSKEELIHADLICCVTDLSEEQQNILNQHQKETGFDNELASQSKKPGFVDGIKKLSLILFLALFVMLLVVALVVHQKHIKKIEKLRKSQELHVHHKTKLMSFIEDAQSKGYNSGDIRQHLLKLGWQETAINQAFIGFHKQKKH